MSTMNRHRAPRVRLVAIAVALVTAAAGSPAALAFETPSTGGCFSSAPVWNAENGTIVSGISSGIIATVLNAVGEQRTHTMVSHGPINWAGKTGWATHSTSLQPSLRMAELYVLGIFVANIPDPDLPLKPYELARGQPGFSLIDMGGAASYWQGANAVFRQIYKLPGIGNPYCHGMCAAKGAADWIWNNVPWVEETAQGGPAASIIKLGYLDPNSDFRHMTYSFQQYFRGEPRGRGRDPEPPRDDGIVCSQIPAYGYGKWVEQDAPNVDPATRFLTSHQYTREETLAAADALWWSLSRQCWGQETGFLADLLFGYGDHLQEETCKHLPWQVVNCFLMGEGDNGQGCRDVTSAYWDAFRADGTPGAQSISPDRLMGLSGHATYGAGVGPWAGLGSGALSFNGGGSTYGCFY